MNLKTLKNKTQLVDIKKKKKNKASLILLSYENEKRSGIYLERLTLWVTAIAVNLTFAFYEGHPTYFL